MLDIQETVQRWHKVAGHPAPSSPTNVTREEADKRTAFLYEEGIREYLDAVWDGDIVGIADAIGDALWIILGTAVVHGIDIEPIFKEIERSNWSKFDEYGLPVPHPTIPGKIGKSDLYEEPKLAPIIAAQVAEASHG